MNAPEILAAVVSVVALLSVAIKLGFSAGRIETAIAKIEPRLVHLDEIPVLKQRIGTVENTVARVVSDISGLKEARGEFRAKFSSMTEEK